MKRMIILKNNSYDYFALKKSGHIFGYVSSKLLIEENVRAESTIIH